MVTATKKVSASRDSQPVTNTPGVSSVSDFKKGLSDLLTLPTGKTIRCQRTSIQTLMAQGLIPNSLMSIVQKALAKGQADISPDQFLGDPQQMQEMLELVDVVIIHCVKEPQVHEIPDTDEPKDPNLLYIDELDDEDRSFIFQFATGGTSDVAQFRLEASQQLASVQSSQVVQRPTKSVVRRR